MHTYYTLQDDGYGEKHLMQIVVDYDTAPDGYTEDLDSLQAILDANHVPSDAELQQMEQMAQIAELQVSNAQKDATIIDMMAQIAQLQLGGTK